MAKYDNAKVLIYNHNQLMVSFAEFSHTDVNSSDRSGIAMHICASQPEYLKYSDIPNDIIEQEKEIMRAQLTGKRPEDVIEKILAGKFKNLSEKCLNEQPYVKDPKLSILKVMQAISKTIGENVEITDFYFNKV